MQFLTTEAAIAARVGHHVDPVRLFALDHLDVSLSDLQRRVAPSFQALPWDHYDVRHAQHALLAQRFPQHTAVLDAFLPGFFAGDRDLTEVQPLIDTLDPPDRQRLYAIAPTRRRAVASFLARKGVRGRWEIERQPHTSFSQASDHDRDYRSIERHFAPSPPTVTDAPEYQAVLERLASLTDHVRGKTLTSLRIICHQMGLTATSDGATNAPEGTHQDGADYIVSALVIERRGVTGGQSIVYGPDQRTEYLRHTLLEGQGLFQADAGSSLWHSVTTVRPTKPQDPDAVRNILGYDIHVTS
jgi:hypothetical protein